MDYNERERDWFIANPTYAADEINQLRAENEALRKDAERYQFAKSRAYVGVNPHAKTCLWVLRGIYEIPGGDFDSAIDAAMKEEE